MLQKILNGFELRIGQWFLWLNWYGFGVGKIDIYGRGQYVHYFKRHER